MQVDLIKVASFLKAQKCSPDSQFFTAGARPSLTDCAPPPHSIPAARDIQKL